MNNIYLFSCNVSDPPSFLPFPHITTFFLPPPHSHPPLYHPFHFFIFRLFIDCLDMDVLLLPARAGTVAL